MLRLRPVIEACVYSCALPPCIDHHVAAPAHILAFYLYLIALQDREGVPASMMHLVAGGKQLADEAELCAAGVSDDSTMHMSLSLIAAGKKRKKKVYTTPKKIKRKHKSVKLAVLKYYKVDEASGKVEKARKECPHADCGVGVFMANHKDRYYCGKCLMNYQIE